jgi:hypothetical protein
VSKTIDKLKAKAREDKERQREEYKKVLWGSRLTLIKKAQMLVKSQVYNEAVICLEKYIKILELIYDCGPHGLTPEHFKESARTNELSIITSAYWDLFRIYDSAPSAAERQKKAAEKIAIFAKYTPLYTDILKKARSFQKQAKQPDIVKSLINQLTNEKGRCFIATSAFEHNESIEVQTLRHFRDMKLRNNLWGRQFIYFYYKTTPIIAQFLDNTRFLKPFVRFFIRLIIKVVT